MNIKVLVDEKIYKKVLFLLGDLKDVKISPMFNGCKQHISDGTLLIIPSLTKETTVTCSSDMANMFPENYCVSTTKKGNSVTLFINLDAELKNGGSNFEVTFNTLVHFLQKKIDMLNEKNSIKDEDFVVWKENKEKILEKISLTDLEKNRYSYSETLLNSGSRRYTLVTDNHINKIFTVSSDIPLKDSLIQRFFDCIKESDGTILSMATELYSEYKESFIEIVSETTLRMKAGLEFDFYVSVYPYIEMSQYFDYCEAVDFFEISPLHKRLVDAYNEVGIVEKLGLNIPDLFEMIITVPSINRKIQFKSGRHLYYFSYEDVLSIMSYIKALKEFIDGYEAMSGCDDSLRKEKLDKLLDNFVKAFTKTSKVADINTLYIDEPLVK